MRPLRRSHNCLLRAGWTGNIWSLAGDLKQSTPVYYMKERPILQVWPFSRGVIMLGKRAIKESLPWGSL